MANIQEIPANELDSEGIPLDTVTVCFLGDADEPAWFAFCEKLPGYLGGGRTQSEALRKLHEEFAVKPIYRVLRVRVRSATAQFKKLAYLELGGAGEASDGWLKADKVCQLSRLREKFPEIQATEGISPSDLFEARAQRREAEERLGHKIGNSVRNFGFYQQMIAIDHPQLARWINARNAIAKHKKAQKR
jgi:hypothetical protein